MKWRIYLILLNLRLGITTLLVKAITKYVIWAWGKDEQ
jgi:hypothetical protein